MKRIAVPTRDGHVDDHFGHCDHYTVYGLDESGIVSKERLDSPEGCGCKSDIAYTLHYMGVSVMLAGNIGQGAVNKLGGVGIEVVRGCKGDVDDLVRAYMNGQVSDNGEVCEHHDCRE